MDCPPAEDKFAWLRDDEFARQAVAGINPVSIERLQVTRLSHTHSSNKGIGNEAPRSNKGIMVYRLSLRSASWTLRSMAHLNPLSPKPTYPVNSRV